MSVKELMEVLSKIDPDKIVILTDPDGIGWSNIGRVIEGISDVKITEDDDDPFHQS
jgi:hypothetical protein